MCYVHPGISSENLDFKTIVQLVGVWILCSGVSKPKLFKQSDKNCESAAKGSLTHLGINSTEQLFRLDFLSTLYNILSSTVQFIHFISPFPRKRCDQIPLSCAVNLIKRLLAVGARRNPN